VRRVGQRRSTWVGIVVVVTFFAGVTLAFAWLGGGPDIPHPVGGDRTACTTCHPTDGLPDGHHERVNDSCRSCHSDKSTDASAPGVGSRAGAGAAQLGASPEPDRQRFQIAATVSASPSAS
jgi:hypothetical protein